ncbi:hypothetical protein KY349_05075 [Candidatus Woesearchaeota archaeon]|nr:hypothetical protein [Candidatus Woesearchaeota archaeon]
MINMDRTDFSDQDIREIMYFMLQSLGKRVRKEDVDVRDGKLAQIREGSPSHEKYNRIIRHLEKRSDYSR